MSGAHRLEDWSKSTPKIGGQKALQELQERLKTQSLCKACNHVNHLSHLSHLNHLTAGRVGLRYLPASCKDSWAYLAPGS